MRDVGEMDDGWIGVGYGCLDMIEDVNGREVGWMDE